MTINTVEFTKNGEYRVNRNVNADDDREYNVPLDNPRGMRKVQAWIDAGNTPTPYVAPVKTWEENRQAEYAKLNQFEMQFDDQRDSTTTWVDAVNAIKVKYPKP